jgi:hypothetical protein
MRAATTLLLAALACAAPARADQVWTALEDTQLDALRGGFALPDGWLLSFGIERTVRVDGEVMIRSALRIPDLAHITQEQARALSQQAVVIQNTQSHRHLQATTEISVSANTLRALQGINLNQAFSDALKGAFTR